MSTEQSQTNEPPKQIKLRNAEGTIHGIDPLELEEYFSTGFKRRIIPCLVSELLDDEDLSATERIHLTQFKSEKRRHSWLRGRRALKILLRDLEFVDPNSSFADIDTSATFFPHPAFSLTHSQDIAIAIACMAPAFGVGIDLELIRATKPQMSKFYLSETDRKWLDSIPQENRNSEQIRLWTVKESVFKSDLNNMDRTMLRYKIEDTSAICGKAFTLELNGVQDFQYMSKRFGDYWISVSLSHGEPGAKQKEANEAESKQENNGV